MDEKVAKVFNYLHVTLMEISRGQLLADLSTQS